MMLAFELQGGWKDVKASVAATVLQFLLGGGGSFSSGGPGEAFACYTCPFCGLAYCVTGHTFHGG